MIIDFKNIEQSVMPNFKGGDGDTKSKINASKTEPLEYFAIVPEQP